MSRSSWTTQFQQLPNQSKFHEEMRRVLQEGGWKRFYAYQEVPVVEVCSSYHSKLHRYDWYIPDLYTVIELHGVQHYKFSNRGNISYNKALDAFKAGQRRDSLKKTAALEEGLTYVEIPYKHYGKLTPELLKEMLYDAKLKQDQDS